jgi:acetoin utilization deacetylase AcuC-like enzyme
VSLGVDTALEDADTFRLVADDFTRIGASIGALDLPTLFVQEGGYDLDAIGRNVVNVLEGFEGA